MMFRPRFALERRLPAWLRPTFRGATVILVLGAGVAGKLYVLTLLITLMWLVGPIPGALVLLSLVGLGMAGGAVGGAVYGVLEPLHYWGRRIGAWSRCFLAILGSLITMILLTPRGPFSLFDTQLYLFAVVVAALGAGFLLFLDDRRPGRMTPRQFERVLAQPRLRAAAARRRAARKAGTNPQAERIEARTASESVSSESVGALSA
ncbi:MAG TPA: hypothetical protein VMK53_08435 [Gemmatimonadales bacterium]|nr:hypothetical protein [Gemmatimonadales bacterium]